MLAVALEGQIAWGLDDVETRSTPAVRDTFVAPYQAAYRVLSHADLVEAARLATWLGWAAEASTGMLPVDEQSTVGGGGSSTAGAGLNPGQVTVGGSGCSAGDG